ncbi:HU family DNA-binding protein [Paracoccus pacificus]|uniref:HU family DNA-binding protein n=1 Tax=Paracoccus pacificus TaxID=1463598 RepID=A0ABW4R6G6_9RHOB
MAHRKKSDPPAEKKAAPAAEKTAEKAAAKATAKSAEKKPVSASRTKPVTAPMVTLHKKDFIARVVAASGVTRREAKPVIEATLEQLGAAFAAGETVALPPFGKARVSRQKDLDNGEVLILRLRRKTRDGVAATADADDDDDE